MLACIVLPKRSFWTIIVWDVHWICIMTLWVGNVSVIRNFISKEMDYATRNVQTMNISTSQRSHADVDWLWVDRTIPVKCALIIHTLIPWLNNAHTVLRISITLRESVSVRTSMLWLSSGLAYHVAILRILSCTRENVRLVLGISYLMEVAVYVLQGL